MFYIVANLYIYSYVMLFIWILKSLAYLSNTYIIRTITTTETQTMQNTMQTIETQTMQHAVQTVETQTDNMGKTDSQLSNDNDILLSILEKSKNDDARVYPRVKLARTKV